MGRFCFFAGFLWFILHLVAFLHNDQKVGSLLLYSSILPTSNQLPSGCEGKEEVSVASCPISPRGRRKRKQEVTAGLATVKETSMDAPIAAVYQKWMACLC